MSNDMGGLPSPDAIAANQGRIVAWVNFDGSGSATIRGSFNVQKVVRNGTGDYTITFVNPILDDKYAAIPSVDGFGVSNMFIQTSTQRGNTRYQCRVQVVNTSGSAADGVQVGLMIVR